MFQIIFFHEILSCLKIKITSITTWEASHFWSVVFCMYSGLLHKYKWLPRYDWNIVESALNTITHPPDHDTHTGLSVWNSCSDHRLHWQLDRYRWHCPLLGLFVSLAVCYCEAVDVCLSPPMVGCLLTMWHLVMAHLLQDSLIVQYGSHVL